MKRKDFKSRTPVDEPPALNIAKQYITGLFTPIGAADDREYITSAEIRERLIDMVDFDISGIADLMSNGGYKIEILDGIPYWIVYYKIRERN